MSDSSSGSNWAGNYVYGARVLHRPASVAQVQEIVARADNVHVLGARHSFNAIADSAELITLTGLPPDVVVDRAAGTVSISAGMTYGHLAELLDAQGLALHNLASLLPLSVGGAVSTGTHGSGDANGSLSTAVAALELVDAAGELVRSSRGDADFDGLVVGLGAVGAVTRVTLDVEPAYAVRQRVFEGLQWKLLLERFDDIMACGDSVSVFTRLETTIDQVWVKSRVTDAPEVVRPDLFGATAATVDRHPLLGMDPVNCTPQLGRPGPWWDRLPHFRRDFFPSTGHELQSEFLLPRSHAAAALEATLALADRVRPVLQMAEIRTVAGDRLWMSPEYGRETVAIHFTWHPRQQAVEAVLVDLEAALAPFAARPHWGKLFVAGASELAPLYERRPDFLRLLERLDPRGTFRNRWLDHHVLGVI